MQFLVKIIKLITSLHFVFQILGHELMNCYIILSDVETLYLS